jgi:hypothetical protein
MAHITENRILETSTSTGTGAIALAAAVTGFRRFSAVCAVGDTVPYFIEALDSLGVPTGDYEYGVGTYSGANTLTRTTVMGSSNAGALVSFAAGTKNVGVAGLSSDLVPVGTVITYAGAAAPAGYVAMNGAALSRVQYPGLWSHAQASGMITASDAAWATDKGKFSPGDGATTFRVPDVRGEFIRSLDGGRGIDAGRTLGSAQSDQFKSHTHPYTSSNATSGTVLAAVRASAIGDTSTATEAVGGTETRPRNVAYLMCIKF